MTIYIMIKESELMVEEKSYNRYLSQPRSPLVIFNANTWNRNRQRDLVDYMKWGNTSVVGNAMAGIPTRFEDKIDQSIARDILNFAFA